MGRFTNLCDYLTPEERLKLFDMLCAKLQKRLPERIWLATEMRIPRTHVYRYLDRPGKKRMVPSSETTALIIEALLVRGGRQEALSVMKSALHRMISATLSCCWRLEFLGLDEALLTKDERQRLRRAYEGQLVSDILRDESTL